MAQDKDSAHVSALAAQITARYHEETTLFLQLEHWGKK